VFILVTQENRKAVQVDH